MYGTIRYDTSTRRVSFFLDAGGGRWARGGGGRRFVLFSFLRILTAVFDLYGDVDRII